MRNAKRIALGGILAAVAMVVMCLGGLIPVATYVCPMVCCIIGQAVVLFCGNRIAWAWYCVVALLSLLIGPDKEAGIVYLALGYYPNVKPFLDTKRFGWLLKFLLFNGSILISYSAMIFLLGMGAILEESQSLGTAGLAIMLVLGNVVFFLLDRVLLVLSQKLK